MDSSHDISFSATSFPATSSPSLATSTLSPFIATSTLSLSLITSSPATSSPATSSPATSSPATSSPATSSPVSSPISSPASSPAASSPSPVPQLPHPSHLFRISHLVLPDGSFRGPNGRMERLTRETQHSVLPSPVARSQIETVHWPRSESKDIHELNLRVRDLTATRQQLLRRSYVHFLGKIFCSTSFTTEVAIRHEMAISSYKLSMVEHISLKNFRGTTSPIKAETALILAQPDHLLSRLKEHARELIPTYGLFPPEINLQAEKNRRIVTMLLTDMAFIHPDNDAKQDRHYQNPNIQEIINRAWFSEAKSSVGLRMDDYFTEEMIPLATIAHVVTVLEHAIGEWATGACVDIPFDSTHYKQRFLEHLEMLRTWETVTYVPDETSLTDRVRRQLFSNARTLAIASKQ